jgi:AraC-like DNA-binding protein
MPHVFAKAACAKRALYAIYVRVLQEAPDQLCYAARLSLPFVRVLQRDPRIAPSAVAWLELLDADERVPAERMNQLLKNAEAFTGDESLGLKAVREMAFGDIGALDYAMSSAADLGTAIAVAGRFGRLINDALRITLEQDDVRAIVKLESVLPLPRTALDFGLVGLLWNHMRLWPEAAVSGLEVWFPYPAPRDLTEHRLVLPQARLHFDAPFAGFGFPAPCLSAPLRSTDRKLHQIMSRHAERELAALPKPQDFVERVRALIASELATGDASAERMARKLQMSRRTLNRRLDQAGTSVRVLLDEVRKEVSLRHLSTSELSIPEIALLTGFSEAAAFYRAFRRWTTLTPAEYRRTQRKL